MKQKKSFLIGLLVMAFLLFLPAKTQAAEYKGVWFSYYDYEMFTENYENTGANFKTFFNKVLDNCKSKGFNHIIVQVRPFSDAIYKSSYFPTSAYIAGKQGKSLSYDPLTIMVAEAHKKGMRIEAWINPYRVATNTSYKKLSTKNPARKWHYSKKSSYHRYVLSYGGKLYYNPSKPGVRKLIINGVKEIVRKYDVDGIHMDDYFYPSFSSSNYKKAFDAKEYKKSAEKKSGMSIQKYRRKQVSTLVSGIKSAIKAIDPSVTFGISPAGEINNLTDKYSYYVDITKWVSSTKYVDYIAPQIYWGFNHSCAQYDKMVNQWLFITDRSKVKIYIGLPAYKMGVKSAASNSKERTELLSSGTLSKMVQYGREKGVHGFIVFDYSDIMRSNIQSHISKLTTSLQSIK